MAGKVTLFEVHGRDARGEEAIEWASRCPASENEVIEIRQVQELADFPADVQDAAAGFSELQARVERKEG